MRFLLFTYVRSALKRMNDSNNDETNVEKRSIRRPYEQGLQWGERRGIENHMEETMSKKSNRILSSNVNVFLHVFLS